MKNKNNKILKMAKKKKSMCWRVLSLKGIKSIRNSILNKYKDILALTVSGKKSADMTKTTKKTEEQKTTENGKKINKNQYVDERFPWEEYKISTVLY